MKSTAAADFATPVPLPPKPPRGLRKVASQGRVEPKRSIPPWEVELPPWRRSIAAAECGPEDSMADRLYNQQ